MRMYQPQACPFLNTLSLHKTATICLFELWSYCEKDTINILMYYFYWDKHLFLFKLFFFSCVLYFLIPYNIQVLILVHFFNSEVFHLFYIMYSIAWYGYTILTDNVETDMFCHMWHLVLDLFFSIGHVCVCFLFGSLFYLDLNIGLSS